MDTACVSPIGQKPMFKVMKYENVIKNRIRLQSTNPALSSISQSKESIRDAIELELSEP